MRFTIEPFTKQHVPCVRAFNARLRAAGCEFEFPESDVSEWLPKVDDGRRIYEEFFVAAAGDAVRGAYILKSQEFSFHGETLPVGYYHLPLSEGIVDKNYGLVGTQLVMDALRRQPMLYALGMGGFEQPLPRMLKALGWPMYEVPFYFKAARPARFLRNIRPLRTTAARRAVLDAAAFSGAGWAALTLAQARLPRRVDYEVVPEFGAWADEIWERCHPRYAMIGSRDARTLRILYPSASPRFMRVAVRRGPRVEGWAVLLNTQMRDHKYFGDMRVGTIADCLAAPEDAPAVIHAAAKELAARGVDLIVSNQCHDAWRAALQAAGFRGGPSNFVFAASKKLAARIAPFDETVPQVHLTRGDGDGPIHL